MALQEDCEFGFVVLLPVRNIQVGRQQFYCLGVRWRLFSALFKICEAGRRLVEPSFFTPTFAKSLVGTTKCKAGIILLQLKVWMRENIEAQECLAFPWNARRSFGDLTPIHVRFDSTGIRSLDVERHYTSSRDWRFLLDEESQGGDQWWYVMEKCWTRGNIQIQRPNQPQPSSQSIFPFSSPPHLQSTMILSSLHNSHQHRHRAVVHDSLAPRKIPSHFHCITNFRAADDVGHIDNLSKIDLRVDKTLVV